MVFHLNQATDYERLVSKIRSMSSITYVSPATYIPLPPMAPAEMPRAQLITLDSSTRISIAANRADFFISSLNSFLSRHEIDTFYDEIALLSKQFLSDYKIHRLGLVTRLYIETLTPETDLANSLLKNRYQNLAEVSIKITERNTDEKPVINDSYQFDTGFKTDTQEKLMLITRDINTPPETTYEFNLELLNEFISLGKSKLKVSNINKILGE